MVKVITTSTVVTPIKDTTKAEMDTMMNRMFLQLGEGRLED
jgi:hypothetical protein